MKLFRVFIILGITTYISGCLGLLIPFFMDYKGFSVAEIGFILAIASVTSILTKLFIGYLTDKIGAKIPLIISLILGIVSIYFIIYVKNVVEFSSLRLLFGVSSGMSATILGSLLAYIGKNELSLTMGKYSMVVAVANSIIGPASAGFLATYLDYNYSFLFLTLLLFISLIISLFVEKNAQSEDKIEDKGNLKIGRSIILASLFQFLALFIVMIIVTFLVLYTSKIYNKTIASLTSLIAGIPFMLSPYFGKLAERFGKERMIGLGFLFYSLSLLVFKISFALPIVFISAFVSGLGGAISSPSIWALGLSGQKKGIRMGIMQASSEIGTMIGNASGGLLVSIFGFIDTFFITGIAGLFVVILSNVKNFFESSQK